MKPHGNLLLFVAALLLGSVLSASAALTFEQAVVKDVVSPEAKNHPFTFAFENTGDFPIEITDVKTSCGCTAVELEQKLYQPGDKGVIEGSFSVGDRRGLQQSSISVSTDNLGQPTVKLGLSLEIPQLLILKPGLLLWRVGAELEAKELTMIPNADLRVKIVSIETDGDTFSVVSKPSVANEGSYILEVSPSSLASSVRSVIRIEVATADPNAKSTTIFAHAIVR